MSCSSVGRPLSHTRPTPLTRFPFGVCYYPEHCDPSRWVQDAARMNAARITLARMAEFAWAILEPEENRFDFELFDRAIDVLAAQGVQTVLCTPTATPPRWLTRDYPDVLRVDVHGRPMAHGSRQHASNLSPAFRAHSERITAAMADHYRDHPHVVGWQTDNEFNCHFSEDHSPAAQQQFTVWCRQRYGNDIGRLNDAWGTVFWSQTYAAFEDLLTPHADAPTHLNPAHVLDYHRFLSDGAASFQRDQVRLLRAANPDWWITHNGTFDHIDYAGPFTEDLDFLSFDSYPMFNPDPQARPAWDASRLDRTRGWSGNFVVMEQQAGAGGQPPYLHDSPAPGEMRQFAWRSIARGADGLFFFRWRSCRFGAEQYWQGLIDHDNVARRRYEEAARLGEELEQLGPDLLNTSVRADAAIAGPDITVEDAFDACDFGLPAPKAVSHDVHRNLFERGVATGYVHPTDDLSAVKLYVIPHWTVFDPDWAEPLQRWVEQGGVLLVGALTATRDTNNNVLDQTPPGVLAELAGVTVSDYTRVNAPRSRPMDIALDGCDTPISGEHWIERLTTAEGTDILGRWRGQWFDGQPAVTLRRVGKGAVVYAGAWLTPALTDALMPRLLAESGVKPLVADLPPRVEAVQRVGPKHRLTFLLNHGEEPAMLTTVPPGRDALTDQRIERPLRLEPFGVSIIREPVPAEATVVSVKVPPRTASPTRT